MQLIVDSFGAQLSFSDGVVLLEKKEKKEEIPLLHIHSIHILQHARISSALITECARNDIPVFFETALGVEALILSPGFGSVSAIRKKQALFSFTPERFDWIKNWLTQKIERRYLLLQRKTTSARLLEKGAEMSNYIPRIRQATSEEQIRGYEGNAGRIWFDIIKDMTGHRWGFQKRLYRNPDDPVNALLNYGYGVLYNAVTRALIVAGLDPAVGWMHQDRHNRLSLTYDFIEPYRVWADLNLIEFCRKYTTTDVMDHDRRLKTEPRRFFIRLLLTYLNKKTLLINQRKKTPLGHLQADAYQLAQFILKLDTDELIAGLRHSP